MVVTSDNADATYFDTPPNYRDRGAAAEDFHRAGVKGVIYRLQSKFWPQNVMIYNLKSNFLSQSTWGLVRHRGRVTVLDFTCRS